ncbi:MAG: aldolase/citrate lyase family protein [Gordonia sp. (in: high G+C Gram-positive bacteria)]|uniref:DUF6986 family protein n=1 Tax=Gordonia sp. (in: high G+C Gram-positive bacteria) TaxID=84139 RepID=UPI0039E36EB5
MEVDLDEAMRRVDALLEPVDAALARQFPGDRTGRQPIHSVYVPADRADENTVQVWGDGALALLEENRDVVAGLGDGVDIDGLETALRTRPIQDLRIDFEDGYKHRDDASEDADARRIGGVLAGLTGPGAPERFGIRPRGLEPAERRRGMRTLELVLEGAGGVPDGFVFTVPKIRSPEQIPALVTLCEIFEKAHGLAEGTLTYELQIESPHIVLGADGTAGVARAIRRSEGRCTALHFGTYDYTTALGVAPRYQSLAHPTADHAKNVMMLAAAQAGVWVSDGSTQVIPQGTEEEVTSALVRHFDLVTRSLTGGIYQGWDLHPGHLVTRWAATLSFYRGAMPAAATRIDAYCRRSAGGSMMDEPATAQSLSALVLRGLQCGAFTEAQLRVHAPRTDEAVLTALSRREPVPASAQ